MGITNDRSLLFLFSTLFIILIACSKDVGQGKRSTGQMSGKQIFKQYCVNCHGIKGNLGLNGAGDLTKSELSLEQRRTIIINGKNTMTAFKTVLSEKDIDKVAQFTMTLNKSL